MRNLDFEIDSFHQTERVFSANQLYLHVHLVHHVPMLKEYVGKQTTHHVYNSTLTHESTLCGQALVDVVGKI